MKSIEFGRVLVAVAAMGASIWMAGCKPDFTQANAQALLQAEFDHRPAEGVTINVDELGLKQGLTAKYWTLTKVYANNKWADYALTDDGKKALKLAAGGTVIQWRPDTGAGAPHFAVVSVAANHLRARDVKEIRDEVVPGVSGSAKVADFTESVNLDGVPDPLQAIAHNPGNKLSAKHTANFELDGGVWKLHSID